MYRTIKIKLDRSNELVQTARLWNAACQDVIDYGFAAHDYNKTRLNKATYKFFELFCSRFYATSKYFPNVIHEGTISSQKIQSVSIPHPSRLSSHFQPMIPFVTRTINSGSIITPSAYQ